MTTQEPAAATPLIYGRMARIIQECGPIAKSSKNTQQNYAFRGIDAVYNELHDVFATHEVFILPTVISEVREVLPTKAGGTLNYTVMRVSFRFMTVDGSYVECTTTGEASDSGDKSCNKAMSTAMKYALFMVFLIPTEGDNDTENHSPEFTARSQPAATKQATQRPAATQPVKTADANGNARSPEEIRREWLDYIETAADLNSIQMALKALRTSTLFPELKAPLHQKATALGFLYDAQQSTYVNPKTQPVHAAS